MLKGIPVIIALFVSILSSSQDLAQIRSQYPEAAESSTVATKLNAELKNVTETDKSTLVAYKGGVLTLMAKFAHSKKEKKEFFQEGVDFLQRAVTVDANNIEIRYIRLSVQESSPSFLGYYKNIEEDKKFIIDHFNLISSKPLGDTIKNFVLHSKSFNASEKNYF